MVDRRDAVFGMPQIRDVRAEKEPRPTTEGPSPADLLFLSRKQLDASLADIAEIDGQPPDGPGLLFVPWGGAALGVPFCPPREGQECWPVKGGLDDNPFAWVCVCESPPVEGGRVEEPAPIAGGPCYLDLRQDEEGPQWVCRNDRCRGECRLVITLGKPTVGKAFQPFVLSCQCHRRTGPQPPFTAGA